MQKAIVTAIIVVFSFSLFAQEIDKTTLLAKYEKKRTTNVVIGWSALGAGTAMMIAGFAMDKGEPVDPFTQVITGGFSGDYEHTWDKIALVGLGTVVAASSILFFEFARHNKVKAASLVLTLEPVSQLSNSTVLRKNIPAISLKIKI
jgi:hypothetical protein